MSYVVITANSDAGTVGGDFSYVVAPLWSKICFDAATGTFITATADNNTGNEFGLQSTIPLVPVSTDLVTLSIWVRTNLTRPTATGTSTTLLRIRSGFSGGSISHSFNTTTGSLPYTQYDSALSTVATLLNGKTPTEVFVDHAATLLMRIENTFTNPNFDMTGTVDVFSAQIGFGTPPPPTSVSIAGSGGLSLTGDQPLLAAGAGAPPELHGNQWGLLQFVMRSRLEDRL